MARSQGLGSRGAPGRQSKALSRYEDKPMSLARPDDRIAWIRLSSCYLPLATPMRRQSPDRPSETDDRDRHVVRGNQDREWPRGSGLQLLEAGRRPGTVCACQGNCTGTRRRRPERHRQAMEQAVLGRRLRRPQWLVDAGHRRLRRRVVRPEGKARRPVAGQTARLASRISGLL
jgi:hypothetical protein